MYRLPRTGSSCARRLICWKIIQMHRVQVHALQCVSSESSAVLAAVTRHLAAVASDLDGLLEALFDPVVDIAKVKSTSFFECYLEFESGVLWRDASAGNRLDDGCPGIRAKPWRVDMGIMEI
jgi:hypothetical protein